MDDPQFKILSQGYNVWKVQALFPRFADGATVSLRLQQIKSALARQFNIPEALVEYDRMVQRERVENGLTVQIQFHRRGIASGAPQFRLLSARGPDGTVFSDMILEADIYPLDQFDHFIALDAIQSRISSEGVDLAMVNWKLVTDTLARMAETYEPCMSLKIGSGIMPDFGQNARILYNPSLAYMGSVDSMWIGCFPVKSGDVLVDAIPATSGRVPGKNLVGREIDPRFGINTRLEAGDGVKTTSSGSQLVAARDGLVLYERAGRDKRERDGLQLVPARLSGRIEPVVAFHEAERFDVDLYDAAVIDADVLPGSSIRSQSSICIQGNVGADSTIECRGTLRIGGAVSQSKIFAEQHICLLGGATSSSISAGLTAHLEGSLVDCDVRAMDVIASDVKGGQVEALSHTDIQHLSDSEHGIASVRVNVLRFLELQQSSGRAAIDDLRDAMAQVMQIFGPEIVLQAEHNSQQRLLLQWLRKQKAETGAQFTAGEVHDFRLLLEAVPVIRQRLAEVGTELREVTQRIQNMVSPTDLPASESPVLELARGSQTDIPQIL